MSWAEIKKAVNSDLSKPLNESLGEKFGLQLVRTLTSNGTISGFDGIVNMYCNSYDASVTGTLNARNFDGVQPSSNNGYTNSTRGNSISTLFITKTDTVNILINGDATARIFSWGGGIS